MIVINKLDSDNIHFDELLGNIRATFGKACVLWNAPINIGTKFSGVLCMLNPPGAVPHEAVACGGHPGGNRGEGLAARRRHGRIRLPGRDFPRIRAPHLVAREPLEDAEVTQLLG